ncbi:MAG: PTS sugar transporter subunit IIA [Leptothrix ochracea]|uniref:PTS sugar transporter subunit IIA n=1 Tax=Leptothrix ochracea TaxID=735331 RepID=UPI0034E255FD
MVRLLIVAHAPLASALQDVARHVFPEPVVALEAVDVQPQHRPEDIEAAVRAALDRHRPTNATDPDEALILTDVFGATPANVAQRVADGQHVRILAGVNVPMLWRALAYAALPLDELINRAMVGGAQGVMPITPTRPQNQVLQPSHDSKHHHHQQ